MCYNDGVEGQIMKRIDMTIDFKSDVETVFKTVTNLLDCSWRSDLSKVEQVGDNKLIEYNRKQKETKICITDFRKNIQFDYNVENNNYRGHWSGQFAPLSDGGCRMFLTFDFEPQSMLGKFVRVDKFEERYIEDLKKKLQEY